MTPATGLATLKCLGDLDIRQRGGRAEPCGHRRFPFIPFLGLRQILAPPLDINEPRLLNPSGLVHSVIALRHRLCPAVATSRSIHSRKPAPTRHQLRQASASPEVELGDRRAPVKAAINRVKVSSTELALWGGDGSVNALA